MTIGIKNYFLGCPIWANKDWIANLFTKEAKPQDFLRQYANVFNTVEGNNTFYGLPPSKTVLRWKSQLTESPGFRFCFKFPRHITHVLKLNNIRQETNDFFKRLEPLAAHIGVLFLQFPPSFAPQALPSLKRYLETLPTDYCYAVEVRHPDFFSNAAPEHDLNRLLEHFKVNRSLFNTQTLHAIQSHDPSILKAQQQKPKVAPRFVVTGQHPFLRFVGHNAVEPNMTPLIRIAEIVAGWIDMGKQPFIFMHSPNDLYAPHLCRRFHELLSERVKKRPVGLLPKWPGETDSSPGEQMTLF